MNDDLSPEDRIRIGARRDPRELDAWAEELQRTTIDALQAMGTRVQELEDWRSGLEVYLGQYLTSVGDRVKALEVRSRPRASDPAPVSERIVINP